MNKNKPRRNEVDVMIQVVQETISERLPSTLGTEVSQVREVCGQLANSRSCCKECSQIVQEQRSVGDHDA